MKLIVVLEYLFRQTSKSKMDATIVKKVSDEIKNLNRMQKEGHGKLSDYLINQNGKQLKGQENLWKYKLTDGDRIIYTYGKYLKWMPCEYQDSLVIVAYSKHDDQGHEGSTKKQEFYLADKVQEIFGKLVECDDEIIKITDNDLEVIHELLREDFNKEHAAFVINPDNVEDASLRDVILSKEQERYINEYISNQQPLYVRGGAGTGKTIMAIHIMKDYRSANPNKRIGYFTQSDELMNKINARYNYIFGSTHNEEKDEKTEFINLNTFCRRKNEVIDKNFIKTDEFMKWVKSESDLLKDIKKNKIELLPLWAEIRGVIKGALNDKWFRTQPLNRLDYEKKLIDELNEKGLLIWEKDGKRFTVDPNKQINNIEFSSKDVLNTFKEICNYFRSVDTRMKAIRKEDYMNISSERSVLDPEHREFAYKVYQEYQKWLNLHKYVDENDLILKTVPTLTDDDKFDLVVIDEVQDYTELQIWFLNQLVKNNSHFVMAGDTHQNINPTVFNESRLGMFLRDELKIDQLSENFRCQKEIVQYANGLAKIRNKYIGKTKGEIEETSTKKETDIKHVIKLNYTKENAKLLVQKLSKFPDAAILVANDVEKEKFNKYLSEDNSSLNNIFTIAEIKGMEYQYVVCANVISAYNDIWKRIYETTDAKKQSRFRYFFNMFYVGLTRAQETLVIFEENEYSRFYEDLQQKSNSKFYNVATFNEDELNVSTLTDNLDNSFSQAQKYEEQGLYEQAIALYTRANADVINITRCQMKLLAKNKEYISALRLALLLNDEKALEDYTFECDEEDQEDDVFLLASIYLHPEVLLDGNDWDRVNLEKLIKENYHEKEEAHNLNLFFSNRIELKIGELIEGDVIND